MTSATAEQLAEWKRLADAATPGPWIWPGDSMYGNGGEREGDCFDPPIIETDSGHYGPEENDRDFIAAARTAVPSLIAEVGRLREALAKAADQFEFYAREHRTKAQACEFNGMPAAAESALAKALTNERFAAMCRAVVPEVPADGT